MRNNRGQNTIEYVLLIAAVLTVFIYFLAQGGKFQGAIKHSLFDGTIKQTNALGSGINL